MTEKTDLPALIAEVRRLDAEATKGPWFYNSYSGVFSEPVSREYDAAVEALPDDAPAEAFDGLVEPCCAHVPVVGGDTATAQGARDAALIAEYRTAAPLLADECSRLQAEVTQLRAERDMPCAHRLEEERLQERVRVLEAALRPFQTADGHFAWCRRAGFGGVAHHDHNWDNGNEPATACSDHCWTARAALEGIEVE